MITARARLFLCGGVDIETCLLLAPGMEPQTIGKPGPVVTLDKNVTTVTPQTDR